MDSFLANTIKSGTSAGQPIVPTVNFQNGSPAPAPAPTPAPAPAPQPATVAYAPQTAPTQTVSATPPGLDPQIVNLARAIRQQESGGDFTKPGASGEYGAYQFLPSTWQATAPKYGVNVPLNQATPEQQNEVAYKQLAEWKQQHPDWNIGNFASAWNAGAGKPNAYIEGNVGTNAQGVKYDTPAYALAVAQYYQQFKAQSPEAVDTSAAPTPETPPSLGGFAGNVVKSGAQLLGNVGEAILHPIQTVQNIGGAAVGGLEKVAGQENENTAKFDALTNFFKNRYGSLDALEKTLYHDPVGVAADLSAVLGVGGAAAGLAGKVGKVGELTDAAGVLNKASDLTNPLSPIVAGVGKLTQPALDAAAGGIGRVAGFEPATINTIRENPSAFTPSEIAKVTRQTVGEEVATALNERLTNVNEASAAYKPIRAAENQIPVSHNFLEDQLRTVAKLDVQDGKIVPNTSSAIRTSAEISKLQEKLNLYKPAFQRGYLTNEEFLNLRHDLGQIAYNDLGKKNTDVARITDQIRANLNKTYRGKIEGLAALDEKFSKEFNEFKALKKGILDKNGNLTDSAYSLIANAGNPTNAARLARLEQIVPGIGEKLKVLKAIEDIQRSMGNKVGAYGKSIAEYGTIVGGAATGNLYVVAAGIASGIIAKPENAVRLIRAAELVDPKVVPLVLGRLARYATISSETNRATQDGTDQGSQGTSDQTTPTAEPVTSEATPQQAPQ